MALGAGRGGMAVGVIDRCMTLMERRVVRTRIALFNAADGCCGGGSYLGDSPGDLAGSTQKNPGKPRLRILGSACRRIAVLLFVLVCF